MTENPKLDSQYATMARACADSLMRFARDRRQEDQKDIAQVHMAMCRLRRQELEEEEPDADSTGGDVH